MKGLGTGLKYAADEGLLLSEVPKDVEFYWAPPQPLTKGFMNSE